MLMRNPQMEGRLGRKDCDLSNWAFWSDQKSKEHIQFTAYKCRERIKRSDEEYSYTQQEIYSVLKWCSESLNSAKRLQGRCPNLDCTRGSTSQAFFDEMAHQAQERQELWETLLRPYLNYQPVDVNLVD
jgi:hypothetical protein